MSPLQRSASTALVLHAGAHEASRERVYETKTPEATETFTPIPHGALITLVTNSILSGGQRIVREAFGLWRDDSRMFGVLQVANGQNPDDYGMLVGIRNSHDKAFAASIALGALVFVCDNMSFSGEVTLARMHTRHILRDLPALVNTGIAKLHAMRGFQDKRIAAYKEAVLTDKDANDLVIRGLRARVINVQRVDDVVKEWYEPRHEEFKDRTAWSLFNGFTESLKGSGADLQPRTLRLHGLMDQYVGLAGYKETVDAEVLPEGTEGTVRANASDN